MKINFLLGVPVMGELSPNTVKTEVVICESCKRRKTQYTDITYVFDRWRGEDIIRAAAEFFISQRFKEKLEEKKIKGYKLKAVKTTFSKQLGGIPKFGKGAYQKELPNFYHLEITGRAEGDIDDWYEIIDPKECPKCKTNKKLITIEGIGSMETPELSGKEFENPLSRNVYKKSWQRDDVFLLQDGLNKPIITQNFIDVLFELGVKINQKEGVWFRPTNWIDDKGNTIR